MGREVTRAGRRQITYAEDADMYAEMIGLQWMIGNIVRRPVDRSEVIRWLTRLGAASAQEWTTEAIERHFAQ